MEEVPNMDEIPKINPGASIVDPPELSRPVVGNSDSKEVEELISTRKAVQESQKPKLPKSIDPIKRKRMKKIFLGIGIILLLLLLAFGIPSIFIYKKARKLLVSAKGLEESVKKQDITEVKKSLTTVKNDLVSLKGSYKLLSWTSLTPFFGGYWRDGQSAINAGIYGLEASQLVVETIEPFADIIGFVPGGGQAKSGAESANDRIQFIVEALDEIAPKLDPISEKALLAKSEIDKIDPNRYPKKFAGKEVRGNIIKAKLLVDEAATTVSQSKPLIEAAPYLLGVDSPRTYLLLFQNDKELRPTGGFLTAYSIVKVDNGKFLPSTSDDIYNLDRKYRPSVPAPDYFVRYIKGPYVLNKNLRLRDMNNGPDFSESMKLFIEEAKKAGIGEVDGIIGVDTHVVVNLLNVLGEIGVPGYGNFSTKVLPECNCPQVIYELESFADVEGSVVWDPLGTGKIIYAPANYDNRKKIVGPLMNSILSNSLGQPVEKLPDLFNAAYKSLTEKHVLFYMFDESAQNGVESFNIAGRVKDYDGDFLHINDSNLGGRKSNLYVTQEVKQEVKVSKDGSVTKTLEITYKNPQSYDGWLNSVLPNWTRIYVPKGAEIVDMEGFEDRGEVYEELGKTVFSGGFELRPQGVKKVSVTYKLPFKVKGEYKLLIQKQPGVDKPLYMIKVGKVEEELFLATDKEFKFGL